MQEGVELAIDVRMLERHVAELAGEPRHGQENPESHARALEYVEASLRKSGLQVERQAFRAAGRTGVNVWARKAGTDEGLPPFLLCAHYDTVAGSPGADDNASGVTALLEVGRVLGPASLKRSVELVAFDMEELQPDGSSLVGSSVFVKSLGPGREYAGVYNLEMVGYTSGPNTQMYPAGFGLLFPSLFGEVQARDFTGDFLAVVGRGRANALGRRLLRGARIGAPDLYVLAIETPGFLPPLPDFLRSDHAPFWIAGVPAVMVTDTANFRNPHYHQWSDTAETLDIEFLAKVARALAATVIEEPGTGSGPE